VRYSRIKIEEGCNASGLGTGDPTSAWGRIRVSSELQSSLRGLNGIGDHIFLEGSYTGIREFGNPEKKSTKE